MNRSKSIFLFSHFDFAFLASWNCFIDLIKFSIENHFGKSSPFYLKNLQNNYYNHLHFIEIWMIRFLCIFVNIFIWREFWLLNWFIMLLFIFLQILNLSIIFQNFLIFIIDFLSGLCQIEILPCWLIMLDLRLLFWNDINIVGWHFMSFLNLSGFIEKCFLRLTSSIYSVFILKLQKFLPFFQIRLVSVEFLHAFISINALFHAA